MRPIYPVALVALTTLFIAGVSYFRNPKSAEAAPKALHHLAPDGVYFALRYFSVKSQYGITGILPGTKVVCVKADGNVLRVKANNVEFEAKAQDLTNDLDIAYAVSTGDAQGQHSLASYLAQQWKINQAVTDKQNGLFDQRQRELAVKRAAAAEAFVYSNPLDRGPYDNRRAVFGRPHVYKVYPQRATSTQQSACPRQGR